MTTNDEQQPGHEWSDAVLDAQPVISHRAQHRLGWVLVAILLLILLTVLPPLLNVNRYQRRVAQAISASINRPVHFDDIHLHLLPLPGLTIQNFVVQEDPAFGTEPALRANTVEARLRLASLWRRRVEVSHIKLLAPSINLVRRSDGRWNLQGVVTQAGYLQSAPTAQGRAGDTPRFPYIEATEARINIKAGDTKLPWSLLEARLALWLPGQDEWRVRLRGRPLRTDTDVSDVGDLELEGSLGRGSTGVMDQPLSISARWSSTPLGETTKLLLGRDTGLRGAGSAEMEIRGTPAHMRLSVDLHLHNLRRAEFVPRLPMSLDAHCQAEALGVVRALHRVRCGIPTAQSDSLFQGVFRSGEEHLSNAADVLSLEAEVPDLLSPRTAIASLLLPEARPGYFLDWMRVFSSRMPETETVNGSVSLQASYGPSPSAWSMDAFCICTLPSAPAAGRPADARAGQTASASAPGTAAAAADPSPWLLQFTHQPISAATGATAGNGAEITLRVAPVEGPAAPRTAPQPSGAPAGRAELVPPVTGQPVITGSFGLAGAALQYSSLAVATYAAHLVPALADDMPAAWTAAAATPTGTATSGVVALPLAPSGPIQAQRAWGQTQVWTATGSAAQPSRSRRQPRRAHPR